MRARPLVASHPSERWNPRFRHPSTLSHPLSLTVLFSIYYTKLLPTVLFHFIFLALTDLLNKERSTLKAYVHNIPSYNYRFR